VNTEKGRLLEVAAIVDRAGAPASQDRQGIAAMVDRTIRYAARLAERRQAPQFDILLELRGLEHAIVSGLYVHTSGHQLMVRGIVAPRTADASPATEGTRFNTRDVLMRPADRPLSVRQN
jgi:hypothetical protein